MDAGHYFPMGVPDFRRMAGTTGNFLIPGSDRDGKSVAQKIASRFDNITFQAVYASGMMCNIFFHNLSGAEEAYGWIKKLDGVGRVRMKPLVSRQYLRNPGDA